MRVHIDIQERLTRRNDSSAQAHPSRTTVVLEASGG